eukprot:15855187-Heterocapsa_arctica.AAC.1
MQTSSMLRVRGPDHRVELVVGSLLPLGSPKDRPANASRISARDDFTSPPLHVATPARRADQTEEQHQ